MTESNPQQKTVMKKRVVYVLLFSMPALLASIIICVVLFGGAAGILWLFVFGDNPWPSYAENLLTILMGVSFFSLWFAFMYAAYVFGKKQEANPSLNTRHVMHSIRATAILALFVVIYEWNVGNIGTQSEGVMCAEFCETKGFNGSAMSPRDAGAVMCSCVDTEGVVRIEASIGDVMLQQRQ